MKWWLHCVFKKKMNNLKTNFAKMENKDDE